MIQLMEMQTNASLTKILPPKSTIIPGFDPENREQSIIRWCQRVDDLQKLYKWSEEA